MKFSKFNGNDKTADIRKSMDPSTRNMKKTTPNQLIIKFLKTSNKEKILKSGRKITYQCMYDKIVIRNNVSKKTLELQL